MRNLSTFSEKFLVSCRQYKGVSPYQAENNTKKMEDISIQINIKWCTHCGGWQVGAVFLTNSAKELVELSNFGCCQDCQHKADDPVNASVAKWHTREVHVNTCAPLSWVCIYFKHRYSDGFFIPMSGIQIPTLLFTYVHIWQAHWQMKS